MDKDCFIFYVKKGNICPDIAKDVETGFDTWNYGLLPKRV